MKIINIKKFLSILIVIILLGTNLMSTVHCGNNPQDNHTTNLQEIVREMFDTMNQNEVDEFGREINFQIRLEPRQGWPEETNVEFTQTRREAIYIFVAGIVALFIISRPKLNKVFKISVPYRDIAQEALPQLVRALYPRHEVREYALNLLETPEGRERVLRAVFHMRSFSRAAGG